MGALAALVAATVALSAYLVERDLRARELQHIERSLGERAKLVAELLGGRRLEPEAAAELTAIARRAAEAARARVSFVAPDGRVVGDSDVALEELSALESHRDRPEIAEALSGRTATSTRGSSTAGRELFYLATPVEGGRRGVVRLAVDLEAVERAVGSLRRELLAAAGVALLAALAVGLGLSWLFLRPLRETGEAVASIAAGDLGLRLRPRTRDEIGEIAHAVNRMAEELRQRFGQVTADREQLRAVLRGMVEGVLVVGADGRILLANPSLRRLFEIGRDVEGQRPIEAIRNAEIEDLLKQARDAEEPAVREIELGGSRARVVRVHAAGIPTADGERGAVAVFHDVTEARRVEAVRRDFVANASHELRTPLTAILGFAETLLASGDRDEATRAQVGVIHRNSERLARLVDDLLELSRIESGGVRLEPGSIDVARVAESVLESLAPRLKERSIEARVVDEGAPQARADRRAVEHVLENLLDNAAKYTEPGGRIEVRARREGDLVAVDVADTGIGISEADQIRVFERFYRVDRARSRDLGGTGLGLSIVKHLVQAMGGEVRLRSALGLGSTFTFTLPSTGSSAPRC